MKRDLGKALCGIIAQAAKKCPYGNVVAEVAPGMELHAVRRREGDNRRVYVSLRGTNADGPDGARLRFEIAKNAARCGASIGEVEPNDPFEGQGKKKGSCGG